MCASCSSIDFDDFDENCNDKYLYTSSSSTISLTNDYDQNYHFPFFDDFCEEIVKKEDFQNDEQLEKSSASNCDPTLANLIEKDLGIDHLGASRKNAWGNLSYAQLICKAIQNSQYQRLTLSQIYSWIIQYVPHFKDKADRKTSIGWKNSIRHNLSLHHRFVRITNEIPGKSSWWTIDPRDKQIRGRRKGQSNDNSTKRRLLSDPKSFTSVRDINQSLYYQSYSSTESITNILHHILTSSPFQTSNSGVDTKSPSIPSSSNNDIISLESNKQFQKIDHSNTLFHRMVLTLMRHRMNKSKTDSQREEYVSTPPSSIPSTIDHLELNTNSTFDFDVERILDFERTTFGDSYFHIHDLPNL